MQRHEEVYDMIRDYEESDDATEDMLSLASEIDALTAERERLAAENAELKDLLAIEQIPHADANEQLAAANATLDRLREVVPPPENMYYCLRCQEHIVPDCEEHCETCGTYVGGGVIEALQAILYPPETTDDDR